MSILFWLFLFCLAGHAQRSFIRVFNTHNRKIAKGMLSSVKDSSIVLANGKNIYYSEINYIKTRRPAAHTGVWTGIVSATALGIAGAQSEGVSGGFIRITPGELATLGVIVGFEGGFIIGLVARIFNPSHVLPVNANKEQWLQTKEQLEQLIR